MTIGDQTPIITGIDPNDWVPGQTTVVTFTGQNLGTNPPTLSFSPGAGIGYSVICSNDSQIVANVSVASGTPDEIVQVTIAATGYGGISFASSSGQSPNSQPATASVHTPLNFQEVTVIGWVNSSLISLPSGENMTLAYHLSQPSSCSVDVFDWFIGNRIDLAGPAIRLTRARGCYSNLATALRQQLSIRSSLPNSKTVTGCLMTTAGLPLRKLHCLG